MPMNEELNAIDHQTSVDEQYSLKFRMFDANREYAEKLSTTVEQIREAPKTFTLT